MRTLCAFLLLALATGCAECGWGNCCGGSCPIPGAGSQYAQSQVPTSTPQSRTLVASNPQTPQATSSAASSKPERQVEYFDGKQPATYLR